MMILRIENNEQEERKLLINKAILFATKAHEGHRKGTYIQYIMHPIEAATIVASMKFDEELIATALLHDIVEDNKEQFGDESTRVKRFVQYSFSRREIWSTT